ncbi:ABC transporter permease [Nocardioides marmorisolisilvae]|uniref:ABC transporter permease n=1 Tax=Nocardioides marmorisolisilvae TaxID=1542737 RepID=UPI001FE527FA|nr:ABC transporter permease [Nocardioides marmorisolisilvae]
MRRAWRQADYWATLYLRTWKSSVVSSFITPLLYIVAMGVLLGGFIKGDPSKLEGATSYLAFVTPGLLAAQGMNTVVGEVTYPVMGMIKWQRIYFGMIATPLTVSEVVLAHLGFVVFRVATVSAVFLAVMAPFGVFESFTGVILAFLVQLLAAVAFAAPVYALTTRLKDESGFSLIFRLGLIPMFLFSGGFFPVSNLDTWMEWLAKATPLWHVVDLTRMLVLGTVDGSTALIHVVYLVALAAVGWVLAVRGLERRLIS